MVLEKGLVTTTDYIDLLDLLTQYTVILNQEALVEKLEQRSPAA